MCNYTFILTNNAFFYRLPCGFFRQGLPHKFSGLVIVIFHSLQ